MWVKGNQAEFHFGFYRCLVLMLIITTSCMCTGSKLLWKIKAGLCEGVAEANMAHSR